MTVLMDQLFGPARLAPLAEDVAEARERAELLHEAPDIPAARQQLAKLAREIVRSTEDRRLQEEGEIASSLASVTRRDAWDDISIDRLVTGFRRLDGMMRRRLAAGPPDVRRWDLRRAG
jgi:hypothetical protein